MEQIRAHSPVPSNPLLNLWLPLLSQPNPSFKPPSPILPLNIFLLAQKDPFRWRLSSYRGRKRVFFFFFFLKGSFLHGEAFWGSFLCVGERAELCSLQQSFTRRPLLVNGASGALITMTMFVKGWEGKRVLLAVHSLLEKKEVFSTHTRWLTFIIYTEWKN